MDVPWKVVVAFLGVFVAGAIFGGVFTIGARRPGNGPRQMPPVERPLPQLPPAVRPEVASVMAPLVRASPITHQLMTQFSRRLNPTAEQREELRRILGRAGEDLQRHRQDYFENVGRVTERMYADVSAVLTLEQKGELEKMRKQEEERMRKAKEKRDEAAAEKAAKGGTAGGAGKAKKDATQAP